jgi:hypothetical protein
MANLSHISSIAVSHGNTARAGGLAIAGIAGNIAIITITPKTITKS